ncbi:Protein fam72a [Gaertneriomyces sp. JEL0708]|nr:Protein fam72a [Gaertneriomyces sp. JEL0708]
MIEIELGQEAGRSYRAIPAAIATILRHREQLFQAVDAEYSDSVYYEIPTHGYGISNSQTTSNLRPASARNGRSQQYSYTLSTAEPRSWNLASRRSHHGHTSSTTSINSADHMLPQFRTKVVCELACRHCSSNVCRRGMRAILLADMNIELFSTDIPPNGVQLVNDDYHTRNCQCKIRDTACLGCGNIIGYHVTQPCEPCMDACNNGHFWMFHAEGVIGSERVDLSGKRLLWASLARAEVDVPNDYEIVCR